jgi:DNA adenine methylase
MAVDISRKPAEECHGNGYLPTEIVRVDGRWPVPHPIPYQGSKRNIAPAILSYFPQRLDRLVEPFAGSAAISLATAHKSLAGRFLLNDAHNPIVALWREIVDRPDELAAEYADIWHKQLGNERAFYDQIRDKFNKSQRPAYFLYLLARCVKAAIRYNSNGEFNNSPDNRRKGATPATMRERIKGASNLLKDRTEIQCADYLEVLRQCESSDLVYMDPPYQGVTGNRDNRYAPKIDHNQFCDALADLNAKGCMFVVSYDGRMGGKVYGEPLPKHLKLVHIEIHAGRSTQATLLGQSHDTYESLYLSPALAEALPRKKRGQTSFDW